MATAGSCTSQPAIQAKHFTGDEVKIALTEVTGLEHGCVSAPPQFDLRTLSRITAEAHCAGFIVTAHCSGQAALDIAVKAGVNTIEHGYFMSTGLLARMAEKQIAWIPTLSPVVEQYQRFRRQGRPRKQINALRARIDDQFKLVGHASEIGVPVYVGSSAGNDGVPHGSGVSGEMILLRRAGLPLDRLLAAATTEPRLHWNVPTADIAVGNRAEMTLLRESPLEDITALRAVCAVVQSDRIHEPAPFTHP
jgi:imidazolonepropionase-like amidohydrolase